MVDKLGLRDEGVARRYLEINGVWEDHVRYAMTVEEWTDRRDELAKDWVDWGVRDREEWGALPVLILACRRRQALLEGRLLHRPRPGRRARGSRRRRAR